jgi:electron transfer flavoprotein alpha subunit
MSCLVIAEHDNKSLKEATAKVVTAATQIGGPVHVLVAGQDCDAAAQAAAKIAGVEKVLVADDALYAKMIAETMETLILSLADKYDVILAPATTNGKNYMPRVAAKLDVAQISEIIKVVSADTFERPIYAGNATAMPSPRCRRAAARRSSPCAPQPSRSRATAARRRWRRSPRRPIRACPNSSARNCRNRNVPS